VIPISGAIMKPLGWIGVILIIAGVVIVAMRGIPYTKSRNEVEVGPLKVTSQERGLVTPIVGVAAIVIGGVLVFAGRSRTA
jgi:drug/metabolite transporter (DMT)-like permease